MTKALKAYWWTGESGRYVLNWGDALNDTILNHFGVLHEWTKPEDADIVLGGSILEHLPHGWGGTIVGAGKLRERSEIRIRLRNAHIIAVRGPLSAKDLRGDVALGDPGLLAPLMVLPRQAFYDVAVLPHWTDPELVERFPYAHPINPFNGATWVMNEISKARRLITSSLHGVIVADSMGIPRQAEHFDGSDFKWRDYHASIDTELEFGKLILANQKQVEKRQEEIRDALGQVFATA